MTNENPIVIDPNGTKGEVIDIGGLHICLPVKPRKSEILFSDRKKDMQMWERLPMPEELRRIRSMDEWGEMPREFRERFRPYIEEEFRRRVMAFGFTTTVILHTLQADTIWPYNGPSSI